MGSHAGNAIGSHPAPLRATLSNFFWMNPPRTLFFCTRFQKGTFKRFPTKWYTLSLFESQHRLAAHERHSRCPEQLERAVSALSDDPRGRWAGVLSEPANYERRDLVLCTAEGHETGCLIVSTKLMQVLKTCPTSPGAPQVHFGDQAITPLIEGDSGHAAQGGALGKLKFRPFGESRAT